MIADARVSRALARHQPGPVRMATGPFRRVPDFLVVGAQKSGTTSIWRYLSSHPSVRFGQVKEVDYFGLYHAFGERWYRAQFPMQTPWRRKWLVGDASPYYLFHPHAAQRAAQLIPRAKLVVILRNPVDRAYSHFQHVVARGHETLPFESALERETRILPAEIQRMIDDPGYRSLAHERHSYVSRGEYAQQLERWLEWFPRERLHVIASERMFGDPNAAMADLFDFLEIGPRSIESPETFKQGRYDDPMQPETRARLVAHFRPHNQRLEALLGMRFGWDR